jgi:hypothetical protein
VRTELRPLTHGVGGAATPIRYGIPLGKRRHNLLRLRAVIGREEPLSLCSITGEAALDERPITNGVVEQSGAIRGAGGDGATLHRVYRWQLRAGGSTRNETRWQSFLARMLDLLVGRGLR